MRSLAMLSHVAMLFSFTMLIACGDENESINAEPLFVPSSDVEGAASSEGTESAVDENTEVAVDTEQAPESSRGEAELFGAPCIRDAVCDTNLCSGSREAPGVCTLGDEVQFLPFDEFIVDPEAYSNQRFQTEGIIRGVCQRRGCWMELRSEENPSGESMTVKFLDYGFFVPLDSRGAFVRVEGIPTVQTLSAEEVEELLAEGYDPGVVREDGTAVLVRFMASGVIMWNRAD